MRVPLGKKDDDQAGTRKEVQRVQVEAFSEARRRQRHGSDELISSVSSSECHCRKSTPRSDPERINAMAGVKRLIIMERFFMDSSWKDSSWKEPSAWKTSSDVKKEQPEEEPKNKHTPGSSSTSWQRSSWQGREWQTSQGSHSQKPKAEAPWRQEKNQQKRRKP